MTDNEAPTITRESSLVRRSFYKNTLDSLDSHFDKIKEIFTKRTRGENAIEFNDIDELLADLGTTFPFDFEKDKPFFSIENKSIEHYCKSKYFFI